MHRIYLLLARHPRLPLLSLTLLLGLSLPLGLRPATSPSALPSIYLVPRIRGDAMTWMVSATGTPFTAQVVRDLFAGVFGDETAAGSRIGPLVGYDLFQTPWC